MSTTTDPFDRLHDVLVASAERLEDASSPPSHVVPAARRGGGRWRARLRRPSPRVAAVTGLVVLAGGSAVAATAPWNPSLGGEWPGGRPTRSARAVPADQVEVLGVLRRPQSADDRSASVRRSLRFVDGYSTGGVHVDGIRLLQRGSGSAAVLVPVRRSGPRDVARRLGLVDALCVIRTSRGGRTPEGEFCGSTGDLRSGRIRTAVAGLVPDGVARVRVVLRSGRRIEATVRDNFYVLPFTIPDVEPRTRVPTRRDLRIRATALRRFRVINGRRITWLAPDGREVRKARPPRRP